MVPRVERRRICTRGKRPAVRTASARALAKSCVARLARLLAGWLTLGAACSDVPAIEAEPPREAQPNRTDKPVIWCFVGSRDKSDSLSVALESGLITHVAIFSGNRITSNTLDKPETQKAIGIAKEAQADGVEMILVRYLWQTQPSRRTSLSTLKDADYYVLEIKLLRKEAEKIGAKYVGLDTEAYGPTPITTHFRSRKFLREDSEKIKAAVELAVDRVGKVDFLMPAGSSRRHHPYVAIANLGRQRIAEGTYYDRTDTFDIKYPYEIAGMYLNVKKDNDHHAHLQYYLAEEIFEDHKDVWQQEQGLMIWPREHRALDVAKALREFSRK